MTAEKVHGHGMHLVVPRSVYGSNRGGLKLEIARD